MADEVRAEEIGPVAAGAVALRDAGKIELGLLEESAFDGEAGVVEIDGLLRGERAEEIRTHPGMKILADLQSDFDFFGKRRGDVLGDEVFAGVETLVGGEVGRGGVGCTFHLNARGDEGFAENGFREFCGPGHCERGRSGRSAERQTSGESDADAAVRIRGNFGRAPFDFAAGGRGGQVIDETDVGRVR